MDSGQPGDRLINTSDGYKWMGREEWLHYILEDESRVMFCLMMLWEDGVHHE